MDEFKRATSAAVMVLGLAGTAVEAAPVAIGPAVSGDGDGINALWVRASAPPHSVADALNVLLSAGEHISQLAPYIDFRDFASGSSGVDASSDLPDPLTLIENGAAADDALFAVH